MRMTFAAVALLLAAGVAAAAAQTAAPAPPAAPAPNAKCKDTITAKARSAAQLSDASRERRARESAIDNWTRRARDTYGWRYSFWRRAQDKEIKCGGGASAKHCTVTARPCRLL